MNQAKSVQSSHPFFLFPLIVVLLSLPAGTLAQQVAELSEGWYCRNSMEVSEDGEQLTSGNSVNLKYWLPAVVPGTVLTTLLEQGRVPDPFYGMNNEKIPDIYDTGRDHYTYWFYNAFRLGPVSENEEVFLRFRGVNYSCNIYLNGTRVNPETHFGMFLRQKYRVTDLVREGLNHLAVIVYPPDPVGEANGGQAGDGTIARNVAHQYVAGWDWIQPVRDRNTGIWDKVYIERTGKVDLFDPQVITHVPGVRYPDGEQAPVTVDVSVNARNYKDRTVKGRLKLSVGDFEQTIDLRLEGNESRSVKIPAITITRPALWWPNGYGDQPLYPVTITFMADGEVSDRENMKIGLRQIDTEWNPFTRSRQVRVNGQKIFIKGGNWIISDAMLRFSKARYDAEVRFHRDMNLNTIRIWGGAITERPEFYEVCDRYGILVMQDFWISGDGNGRWLDPRKKEDQWTRRNYPDDHDLFLRSAADQIRMLRNHTSLAFWCGGNEMAPPDDILQPLMDSLDRLDGTRWFTEYSTSDRMSFNSIGGNGDGPYGIQPIERFFDYHTFPFNSEIGSVGLPDIEGLKRYLSEDQLVIPGHYGADTTENESRWRRIHPAWRYHKYIPYGATINRYGEPSTAEEFASRAQLVNYNQYRALIEGFTSHMWDWYTGVIIWKTQNPWTAMRGQMYDVYLDPNAGLYGLKKAGEPVHILMHPLTRQVMVANHTFRDQNDLMIRANAFDLDGNRTLLYQELISTRSTAIKPYGSIGRRLSADAYNTGAFVQLQLLKNEGNVVSENIYWLPDSTGNYFSIKKMPEAVLQAEIESTDNQHIRVFLRNAEDGPVAFFIRVSVTEPSSGKRVLPVFYSDNYVSIVPGDEKEILIDLSSIEPQSDLQVTLEGWNVEKISLDTR